MYSEEGLLGWTHSVDEQAENSSPQIVSINQARMQLPPVRFPVAGTITRLAIAVKPTAPRCSASRSLIVRDDELSFQADTPHM